MPYETVLYSVASGVATLTLNRPDKLNAMNDPMKADLLAALKDAERDPAVRCIVITATGRAFCSGQDLDLGDRGTDLQVGELLRKLYHPIFVKLRTLAKPVIAAINGLAAGMGVSLALACDYRILVEGAYLSQAFVKIGLIPDCGGTYFLPRIVGMARAFELAALGDKLDARKCLEWGLANEVVPQAEFASAVGKTAATLAAGPTTAYALLKRALNHSLGLAFEDQLEYESHLQQIAARTADFREGVEAFAGKRQPVFSGH